MATTKTISITTMTKKSLGPRSRTGEVPSPPGCASIASIIYYLGYARHVEDPHPAVQLALIFSDVPPVNISETSDDENEDE